MSINILPDELDRLKGQKFIPHDGEGVVYIKLVFLKPDTMENGDPAKTVDDAKGVILCGQLSEVKTQINQWFDESVGVYKNV